MRERDMRDWKMIAGIDRTGEFIAFDPEELLRDDISDPPVKAENSSGNENSG